MLPRGECQNHNGRLNKLAKAVFVMQLTNLIIMLLSASAVASIVVNGTGSRSDEAISYVEGIAIFVIVILNAGIAAWTENSANSALAPLAKMSHPTSSVVRDGKLLVNSS